MTRLALYAIDAGGTSGCARGVFDMSWGSIEEIVANACCLESWELDGEWRKQAVWLATSVNEWPADIAMDPECGVAPCELLMEGFEHRPGRALSGDPYVPLKITCMIEGLLYKRLGPDGGVERVEQRPTEKGIVSDARLRALELWTVGSDHERDAWRHVVRRLMAKRAGVHGDGSAARRGRRRVVRRR